ncbi:MAG: elongation factor P [Candidatus Omnitrophica bacterium]|nr:elongation factor P [Candidatus Omnitrophota bacterium]MDD5672048.1 elongation factor P [Candidatus Omnitrophota bacterium]
MKPAIDIRVGNVLRLDGKICKVLHQEVRGTGKFGKTVHLKAKNLEDGHHVEKGLRAEETIEDLDLHHVKMQYLYKDGEQFVFMNTESYEQFSLPAHSVGKQEVFLKENMEIDVEFVEGRPISVIFPKIAELKVTSAPPGVKGQTDTTYKEVELENGLKILVPQFVNEGEIVRIDVANLAYLERVPTKSLKNA